MGNLLETRLSIAGGSNLINPLNTMIIDILAQAEPAMPTLSPALMGLASLLGLGSLVCWILEIVNAFKKEPKPLLGILSIVLCSLGGFIIGWVKAKQWGTTKLMAIWTILFIVQLIVQFAVIVPAINAASQGVAP
jgi:hypothetical protein